MRFRINPRTIQRIYRPPPSGTDSSFSSTSLGDHRCYVPIIMHHALHQPSIISHRASNGELCRKSEFRTPAAFILRTNAAERHGTGEFPRTQHEQFRSFSLLPQYIRVQFPPWTKALGGFGVVGCSSSLSLLPSCFPPGPNSTRAGTRLPGEGAAVPRAPYRLPPFHG